MSHPEQSRGTAGDGPDHMQSLPGEPERLHAGQNRPSEKIVQRRRAEELAHSIINAALDAVVAIDETGAIIVWNPQAEKLFGWQCNDAIGRNVADTIIPAKYSDRYRGELQRFRDSGEGPLLNRRLELTALRQSGEEFPVELTISPMQTENGKGFVAFVRDITERKLAHEALQRCVEQRTVELASANGLLEQSKVDFQQFVSLASHDLQAPLRGIAGFAQFLQLDYQGKLDETADEYIGQIVACVRQMQRLINDLLAYSRVEARARAFAPTDLAALFDGAVSLLHAEIENLSAEVTRGELPTVAGDAAQLSQVLQHLIGNALKYHRENPPRVHVTGDRNGGICTIAVRDNGIGIDAKDHARIFEIFRRLHTHEQYPGTGIGLALCRRIVLRHGGRIWVESEAGNGSVFYFTLPDR